MTEQQRTVNQILHEVTSEQEFFQETDQEFLLPHWSYHTGLRVTTSLSLMSDKAE